MWAWVSTNPEAKSTKLRYGYTSMTTPSSVFEYDMKTGEKKLLKQREVLGGFKKEDYATERLNAVARDGTLVPVSIVYRKDTPRDGTAPWPFVRLRFVWIEHGWLASLRRV